MAIKINAEVVLFNIRRANEVCNVAIELVNNNGIIFSPRADDQIIEINLLLMLLYKLGRKEDIRLLIREFIGQIAEGVSYANIFPLFSNSKREIVELEINYKSVATTNMIQAFF